ncbi:uncharacterized protein LOC120780022 isoform X1 [Bactrocera tryoni]|uniref:uncharacterized protein LOC120780022 isoform X1 n=1 Tax=Bactrocera tryoni TaxID=59916 RepID=UPI001A9677C8|nr:uncharacterized protein LOC120780022 isoform X1 [Bactrocera tryoni]
MDIEDSQLTPKAVRSAIAAPRASAPPIAAPRTRRVLSPPRQSSVATPRDTLEDPFEETLPPRCSLCHRPHVLKRCTIFKSMKPAQRQQIARAHGHCMNCLADSHTTFECPTDGLCQYCQRPHHTLFHRFPRRVNPPAIRTNNGHRQHEDPVQRRRGHHSKRTRGAHSRPPAPTYGHRNPPRRPTGLNAVVSTLQRLQRLLGD